MTTVTSIFSENAHKILCRRYFLKGEDYDLCERCNKRHESEGDFLDRVSFGIPEYRSIIADLDFLPNSPTLFNAGTEAGCLSACFVLHIDDNMPSIMDTATRSALIQKWGGGVGYSFSHIRGKGDPISTTHGQACGPVAVLKMLNSVSTMITQAGKRDAAQMGVLSVEHPDIREFIHCKDGINDILNLAAEYEAKGLHSVAQQLRDSTISNFNISVALTDAFMLKVQQGEPEATDLFNEIAQSAWLTGDPGCLFVDAANRSHPTPHLGPLEATNPCLPANSWILTSEGPKQVGDLLSGEFTAIVNGLPFKATKFFKTGTKQTKLVVLDNGMTLQATDNHKILTAKGEWKEISQLYVGEKVSLHNHRGASWDGNGSFDEGWLMGSLVGDGNYHPTNGAILEYWGSSRKYMSDLAILRIGEDLKGTNVAVRDRTSIASAAVTELAQKFGGKPREKADFGLVEKTSSDFHAGFLRGWFDADGSVQGWQAKGLSVRLASINLAGLLSAQRMLARLGVISKIYMNRRSGGIRLLPDGKGGYVEYNTQPDHELVIAKDNLEVFSKVVGFDEPEKQARLNVAIAGYRRAINREPFTAKVSYVVDDSIEDVYDCAVEQVNAFDANGIYVHNCGEQWLLNNESCNLGSITLSHFVNYDKTIDYPRLRDVTSTAVRYLDHVVEVNKFPFEALSVANKQTRRIGLGIMGFADMLTKMHIHYDSLEALGVAEDVMGFIQQEADAESLRLGEALGTYEAYLEGPRYRNANKLTVAPTGTISQLADCSSGCEPRFALENTRNVSADASGKGIQLVERAAMYDDFIPHTAMEISWEWHVRMQAAFQKHVDNSISKTINMPNSATVEDIKQAYLMAWTSGCKGIALYRDGCRDVQVLKTIPVATNGNGHSPSPIDQLELIAATAAVASGAKRRRLSEERSAINHKFQVGELEGYINVGLFDDGEPGELFLTISKEGNTVRGLTDTIGILTSLCLQYGVPLESICHKMQGMAFEPAGFTNNPAIKQATSLVDYIFHWLLHKFRPETAVHHVAPTMLNERLHDYVIASGNLCPDCGSQLMMQEGCETCSNTSCGWSRCS